MHSQLDALPVQLILAGGDAHGVRRWIESVAGWQEVGPEAAAAVPPRLRLADVPALARAPAAALPTLLLVTDDDDPLGAARVGGRADRILAWPRERTRVAEAARSLLAASGPPRATADLRIGGAAGGVGTTTVAFALAGLAAWAAGPTLVITHGEVPSPVARTLPAEALVGADLWEVADPVPGVAHLRVIHADVPVGPADELDGGRARLAIRDLGVREHDVDVLVVRRDRAGVQCLARAVAAVTVIVDDGPIARRRMARAAGGRRVVTLPRSARVARAAVARRVPADVPGSWLRSLAPVLAGAPR